MRSICLSFLPQHTRQCRSHVASSICQAALAARQLAPQNVLITFNGIACKGTYRRQGVLPRNVTAINVKLNIGDRRLSKKHLYKLTLGAHDRGDHRTRVPILPNFCFYGRHFTSSDALPYLEIYLLVDWANSWGISFSWSVLDIRCKPAQNYFVKRKQHKFLLV